MLNRATGDFYLFLQRQDTEGPLFAHFTAASGPARLGTHNFAELWFMAITGTGLFEGEKPPPYVGATCQYQWVIETDLVTGKPVSKWKQCTVPIMRSQQHGSVAATDPSQPVLVVVKPGCLPDAPQQTCTERAAVVFYESNLKIITHVNIGGPRRGREFLATRMAVDQHGRFHLIGTTSDNALPVLNPVQGNYNGSSEGFILTLDPATGETSFVSYLGGGSFDTLSDIAVDNGGNIWIVGETLSSNFPTTRSGVQPEPRGRIDGFVVKISP